MTFAINHTPTPLMALVATQLLLAIDKQRVTWTALTILASFSFAILTLGLSQSPLTIGSKFRLVQPLTTIFSPVQTHLNYYTHVM